MTLRSRIVWVVTVLFALVNLCGMIYAAVMGEVVHTCIHGGLLVLVAYLVWRRSPRRVASY